ncbi:transcription antitermination factor NusB, partial [Saccharomonospora iraqiensis]|uniref:transcription antitermination factor NusB n=1 Tax=Saccharomonospora iraqiensis TaxID=52698 RepID=UPI002D21E7B9
MSDGRGGTPRSGRPRRSPGGKPGARKPAGDSGARKQPDGRTQSDERKQPEGRKPGARKPARKAGERTPPAHDPAREVAFEALRAVTEREAYANLILPELLRRRRITGRDAALATELVYGTARARGLLDDILAACLDRPLRKVDAAVLDGLRLGAYQLLRTRIPRHAAVAATVDVIRASEGPHVTGFANAVLRRVSEKDEQTWIAEVGPAPEDDPVGALAARTAHPRWVARAFAEALGDKGAELAEALAADDARPAVHLLAKPGQVSADELAAITGGEVAPYSPYGVHLPAGGGDPADSEVLREGLAVVQDEGSQLVGVAATEAPVHGDDGGRWL